MSIEKYNEAKSVIQEWLDKQGHKKCWYYPEIFMKLANIFDLKQEVESKLPSREEFEIGCKSYQDELYIDILKETAREVKEMKKNDHHGSLDVLANFYECAFQAHLGQKRDDGSPFIGHPIAVASSVASIIDYLPEVVFEPYLKYQVIAASVVHDVPEDCEQKWTDKIFKIDPMVHSLALQLRNPSKDHEDLSREERKKMDREHYYDPTVSESAIIIKFKDRLHNVCTTRSWKHKRRVNYLQESHLLLNILNNRLENSKHVAIRDLGRELSEELLTVIVRMESV